MSAENEINRRIAEALGWVTGGPRSIWLWKCSEYNGLMHFSPCSSLDDLAAYVLPEIIKRGLWEDFKVSLAMFGVATDARLIMGKPASIAAAALDVLTVRQEATK